jgi:AraC-like DNA-binding protein
METVMNGSKERLVVEYTRFKIAGSRAQAFLDVLRKAIRQIQFRCLGCELARCFDDRECYILRIDWESGEQLRRFYEDLDGQAFHRALRDFEPDIQERRHWELTEVAHIPAALLSGITESLDILPDRPPWNRLYPWILERLHQKILVEQMAEQVNMSPRNFARVFGREFRLSPGEFLDRVRVAAAKSDLEEGQSVEQVAYARGFGSSSTMRRAFLRVTGTTPSQYRHENRPSGTGIAVSAA